MQLVHMTTHVESKTRQSDNKDCHDTTKCTLKKVTTILGLDTLCGLWTDLMRITHRYPSRIVSIPKIRHQAAFTS